MLIFNCAFDPFPVLVWVSVPRSVPPADGGHIKALGLEGAPIRTVALHDTTGAKRLFSRGGVSRFGQGDHTAALPSPLPARLGNSVAFTRRFRSTRLNSEFLRDHLGPFTPSQRSYRGQPCDSEVYFGSRRDSLWPGIWPTQSHELGCGGEMSQSQNTPPGYFLIQEMGSKLVGWSIREGGSVGNRDLLCSDNHSVCVRTQTSVSSARFQEGKLRHGA